MLKLKYLGDINQLVIKNTYTRRNQSTLYSCRINLEKKYKNIHKGVPNWSLRLIDCKIINNEIVTVIKRNWHSAMVAFKNKTVLYPLRKYIQQKSKPCRNQPINLLIQSRDWFLHKTSFYQNVFAMWL